MGRGKSLKALFVSIKSGYKGEKMAFCLVETKLFPIFAKRKDIDNFTFCKRVKVKSYE